MLLMATHARGVGHAWCDEGEGVDWQAPYKRVFGVAP